MYNLSGIFSSLLGNYNFSWFTLMLVSLYFIIRLLYVIWFKLRKFRLKLNPSVLLPLMFIYTASMMYAVVVSTEVYWILLIGSIIFIEKFFNLFYDYKGKVLKRVITFDFLSFLVSFMLFGFGLYYISDIVHVDLFMYSALLSFISIIFSLNIKRL